MFIFSIEFSILMGCHLIQKFNIFNVKVTKIMNLIKIGDIVTGFSRLSNLASSQNVPCLGLYGRDICPKSCGLGTFNL